MKKKIIIYTLLLLAVIWFGTFINRQLNQTISRVSGKFMVEETANINQFNIIEETDTLFFEKEEGKWIMNNYFPVNPLAINYFLTNLSRIQVTMEVSEDLDRTQFPSKEVLLFENNRLKKKYSILLTDSLISVIKLNDSKKYYYANIIGEEATLFNAFSIDKGFWRDKVFLKVLPSQIEKLQLTYPGNEKVSFSLIKKNESYDVIGNDEHLKAENILPDKIMQYLSYYSLLSHDEILEEGDALNEQILEDNLLADIQIDLQNELEFQFSLYKIPLTNQNSMGNPKEQYDVNYLYIYLRDRKEWAKIKYIVIDPLLKEIDYFLN